MICFWCSAPLYAKLPVLVVCAKLHVLNWCEGWRKWHYVLLFSTLDFPFFEAMKPSHKSRIEFCGQIFEHWKTLVPKGGRWVMSFLYHSFVEGYLCHFMKGPCCMFKLVPDKIAVKFEPAKIRRSFVCPWLLNPGSNWFSKQAKKHADFSALNIWEQSDHWLRSYGKKFASAKFELFGHKMWASCPIEPKLWVWKNLLGLWLVC